MAEVDMPVKTATAAPRPRRNSLVGWREYAETVASRFYFSRFYRPIYLFTVFASVVLVVWTAANRWKIPTSFAFVSLEIAVSAFLIFEVLLRMLAFRRRFWSKLWNLVDCFAMALSLVSVFMYFSEEGVLRELEEVAADTVVMLRNALQYVRLAIFLKNHKERLGTTEVTDIDFDELDVEDEFDDDLDEEQGLVASTSPKRRVDDDTDETHEGAPAQAAASTSAAPSPEKDPSVDLARFG